MCKWPVFGRSATGFSSYGTSRSTSRTAANLSGDASAQRQLLRLLFLSVDTAKEWSESERRILEVDSRARNLNAALTREERSLADELTLQDSAIDVREELKSLTELQDTDLRRRDELDVKLLALDRARKEARLTMLRAEQEREGTFRALEHAKLTALADQFPSATETARYILANLLTDAQLPDLRASGAGGGRGAAFTLDRFQVRGLRQQGCACDVKGVWKTIEAGGDGAHRDRRRARARQRRRRHCRRTRLPDQPGDEYALAETAIEELDASVAQRRERIDGLVRRLPKEEAALHRPAGRVRTDCSEVGSNP